MEVILLGSTGIDTNSILSIRAGTTRRQSALGNIEKPFRFPCKLEDCTPLKVDIYDLVGTTRTICHAKLGEQCLALGHPKKEPGITTIDPSSAMEVTFKVQPVSQDLAKQDLVQAEKKKSISVKTNSYMEKHNIPAFLQGILTGLIKECPDNPYLFIAQHFAEEAKRLAAEMPPPPGVPPGEVEALKSQLHAAHKDNQQIMKECADILAEKERGMAEMAGEHMKAQMIFRKELEAKEEEVKQAKQAASTGSRAEQLEKTRLKAKDMLVGACTDGKLDTVLQNVKRPMAAASLDRAAVAQGLSDAALAICNSNPGAAAGLVSAAASCIAGTQAATASAPQAAAAGNEDQLKQLAQEKESLVSENAELRARLEELERKVSSPDAVRDTVLGCLLAGAQDGQLDRLLCEAKDPQKSEENRDALNSRGRPPSAKAAEVFDMIDSGHHGYVTMQEFAEAFDTGVFEEALDVEGLRSRVQTASEEGASLRAKVTNLNSQLEGLLVENQELKEALGSPVDAETEDIRGTARDILTSSLANGDLARVLQSLGGESEDSEDVRIMAAQLLSDGARTGDLLRALEQTRGGEAEARPMTGESQVMELKQSVRETLTIASKDGGLQAALEQIVQAQQDSEVNDLKQKARSTLTRASIDGGLQSALEQIAESMQAAEEEAASNELREAALDTFTKGLSSGDLARILLEKQQEDPEDLENLRVRAGEDLIRGLRSGNLENLLEDWQPVFTDAHDLGKGEEVVRLYDGVRGRVLQRTTTDVFVKLDSGAEVWCGVEDLGQKGVLTAPHDVEEGENVMHRIDRTKGIVKVRTTTEVCVRREDGTEQWYPIEDMAQLLPHAHDVREGDYTIRARDGARGTVLQRTTTDVRIKFDNGTEAWEGAEDIAKAPAKYQKLASAAREDEAMSKAVDKLAVKAHSPLYTKPFKDYYREHMMIAKTPTEHFAKVHDSFPSSRPPEMPPREEMPPGPPAMPKRVPQEAPFEEEQQKAARPAPSQRPISAGSMDVIEKLHAMLEELKKEREALMNQVENVSHAIVEARQENNHLREQVLSRPCSREVIAKFGL
mmetsp:Transcript_41294/g.75342  ORF Transcript_41294/g.75342 Transcript_41294/m.75342 type:complete len:1067 (-) Transcript_41294:66-3266(-)